MYKNWGKQFGQRVRYIVMKKWNHQYKYFKLPARIALAELNIHKNKAQDLKVSPKTGNFTSIKQLFRFRATVSMITKRSIFSSLI